MERGLLRLRDSWPALSVLILAGIVIVLAVQGQSNVTMTTTGTVRWGDSRGQVTPQGYSRGAPIHGIDVIVFLVKGTDIHGLPITEILAKTTTNEAGQYTLTFSITTEEKFVRLMAINSWGEGLSIVPVAAGTFTVDLSVDFGHLAYGTHAETTKVAWYDVAVMPVGASKLVVWQTILIVACIAIASAAAILKCLRM